MMHSMKNPTDPTVTDVVSSCAQIKTSYLYLRTPSASQGTTQGRYPQCFFSFTVFKPFVLMQNTCRLPVGNCILCKERLKLSILTNVSERCHPLVRLRRGAGVDF